MAKQSIRKCLRCGRTLHYSSDDADREAKCPACGSIVLPRASDEDRKALLQVDKRGDVGVVSFTTDSILDLKTTEQLGDELDAVLAKHEFKKMVINFEKVRYLSSTPIRLFVNFQKELAVLGAQVKICSIAPTIEEVFKIMRLETIFDIYKTEQEAVQKLTA